LKLTAVQVRFSSGSQAQARLLFWGRRRATYKGKLSARMKKKIVKPNAEQLHPHNRSVVEFLAQEKQMPFNLESCQVREIEGEMIFRL